MANRLVLQSGVVRRACGIGCYAEREQDLRVVKDKVLATLVGVARVLLLVDVGSWCVRRSIADVAVSADNGTHVHQPAVNSCLLSACACVSHRVLLNSPTQVPGGDPAAAGGLLSAQEGGQAAQRVHRHPQGLVERQLRVAIPQCEWGRAPGGYAYRTGVLSREWGRPPGAGGCA